MKQALTLVFTGTLVCWSAFFAQATRGRPTPRQLGIVIGELEPGSNNDITDVPGVTVGHSTIIRGESIRTGVTAVLPHHGNLFLEKVEGAVEVYNAFGKLAGSTQVSELGQIETPILLTNTLAVPKVADALISYMLSLPGMENVVSINPLVAETNDNYLNDIRTRAVEREDVFAAIQTAHSGPIEQGSVGAGTGTGCMGYKGGIGSASRVVDIGEERYTVGALVQTNFGGRLTVNGVRIDEEVDQGEIERGGSCIIVVATDAPLGHRNLRRLARRSFAGMARAGANFSNGSGDYAIAFTTHPDFRSTPDDRPFCKSRRPLSNNAVSGLFIAVREATEEAIISSVVTATTVTGREGHRREALNFERLKKALGLNR